MSLNQGRGYTSNLGLLQNGNAQLDPLLQFVGVDFKPKTQGYYLVNFVCVIHIIGISLNLESHTTSITKNGGVTESKTVTMRQTNAGAVGFDSVISLNTILFANGASDFFGYVVDFSTTSGGLSYTFNVARIG